MKTDGLLFIFLKDSVSPLEIGECGRNIQIERKSTTSFSVAITLRLAAGDVESVFSRKVPELSGFFRITSSALRRILDSPIQGAPNTNFMFTHPGFSALSSVGTFCVCTFGIGWRNDAYFFPALSILMGL